MLDRLPEGFELLARSYLCPIQMMVKRSEGQMIYGVQFHIEKSFEDYDRRWATNWDHRNRSRDGRIIFENFLIEALNIEERVDQRPHCHEKPSISRISATSKLCKVNQAVATSALSSFGTARLGSKH